MKFYKLILFLFLFLFLFLPEYSIAKNTLATLCNSYSGTLATEVTIKNFNASSINNTFTVRIKKNEEHWLSVSLSNPLAMYFFDISKLARLTGELVDVCYNPQGDYLLGIEWAHSQN